MNRADVIAQFKRWYESTGHWIYNGRLAAVQTWVTRGICNQPSAPAGVAEELAQWIAEDPFTQADLAEDIGKAARRHAVNDRAALELQINSSGVRP